jgi:hypothetical protein
MEMRFAESMDATGTQFHYLSEAISSRSQC